MKKARSKWTIKHPAQLRYLLVVLLAMMVPILLLGTCFYVLVFNLLAKEMAFPEAIMTSLVPVIEQINMLLVIALPVLVLVFTLCALAISHRFAGPILRLERELERILAENDYSHPIRVRKGDDLSVLAEKINRLLKKIKK